MSEKKEKKKLVEAISVEEVETKGDYNKKAWEKIKKKNKEG